MYEGIEPIYTGEKFYLDPESVPRIFKIADKMLEEEHKNDPKPVKRIREVPVPFIKGNPNVTGPVIVTEDWYLKKKKKKIAERSRDIKETQIEMMRLLAKRDRLKFKLGKLDYTSKKESKEIICINIELKDIDAELKMLQKQSGVDLNDLEKGTRFSRFIGLINRKTKKICKKIKKWYKRNRELIVGLAYIIIPVAVTALIKMIS